MFLSKKVVPDKGSVDVVKITEIKSFGGELKGIMDMGGGGRGGLTLRKSICSKR